MTIICFLEDILWKFLLWLKICNIEFPNIHFEIFYVAADRFYLTLSVSEFLGTFLHWLYFWNSSIMHTKFEIFMSILCFFLVYIFLTSNFQIYIIKFNVNSSIIIKFLKLCPYFLSANFRLSSLQILTLF